MNNQKTFFIFILIQGLAISNIYALQISRVIPKAVGGIVCGIAAYKSFDLVEQALCKYHQKEIEELEKRYLAEMQELNREQSQKINDLEKKLQAMLSVYKQVLALSLDPSRFFVMKREANRDAFKKIIAVGTTTIVEQEEVEKLWKENLAITRKFAEKYGAELQQLGTPLSLQSEDAETDLKKIYTFADGVLSDVADDLFMKGCPDYCIDAKACLPVKLYRHRGILSALQRMNK